MAKKGKIKDIKSCMAIMQKRTVATKGGYHNTTVKGSPTFIQPQGLNEEGDPKKSYFIVNFEMVDPLLQNTRLVDVISFNMDQIVKKYAEENDGHVLDPNVPEDLEIIESLRDQLPFNDILNACQVSTIIFSDEKYIPRNGDKVKVAFSNDLGTYTKDIGDGVKREYNFISVESVTELEAVTSEKVNVSSMFDPKTLMQTNWDSTVRTAEAEAMDESNDQGHDESGVEETEESEVETTQEAEE